MVSIRACPHCHCTKVGQPRLCSNTNEVWKTATQNSTLVRKIAIEPALCRQYDTFTEKTVEASVRTGHKCKDYILNV